MHNPVLLVLIDHTHTCIIGKFLIFIEFGMIWHKVFKSLINPGGLGKAGGKNSFVCADLTHAAQEFMLGPLSNRGPVAQVVRVHA